MAKRIQVGLSWHVWVSTAIVALAANFGALPGIQGAEKEAKGADGGLAARRAALAERKIRAALASPTTLEFIETPLRDVVDYLKDLHGIDIQFDTKAMDGVGVSTDTPVTRNLKGVSLRSALALILRDLDLTCMTRNEVLQITTWETIESEVFVQSHAASDIADDEAAATALTAAVEMVLEPPPLPEGQKPLPKTSRVVVLRGLLVVRGNAIEQEQVEELLAQIRRRLKLPEAQAASPLEGWKPGVVVNLRGLTLTKDDLAQLAEQTQIRQLDLTSSGVDNAAVSHLSGLANLEILLLGGNRLTDGACVSLSGLKKLQSLDLAGSRLTEKGFSHFKGMQNLRSLNLSGSAAGDEGLAHLADLTALESLDLSQAWFTSKGLAKLAKLERLQSLSLADTPLDSLAHLPIFAQLRVFDLSDTAIKDLDLDRLSKYPGLQSLNLRGVAMSEMGLVSLEQCRGLRSLTLGGERQSLVSAAAIAHLQKALPKCSIRTGAGAVADDPFGDGPARARPPVGSEDPFGP